MFLCMLLIAPVAASRPKPLTHDDRLLRGAAAGALDGLERGDLRRVLHLLPHVGFHLLPLHLFSACAGVVSHSEKS